MVIDGEHDFYTAARRLHDDVLVPQIGIQQLDRMKVDFDASVANIKAAMDSLERGIKENGDRLERMSFEDREILRNRITE
ncbi:hypothetical protein [Burkholderia sp. PAMC 28687]|uniref:hypothetical protein n=1 Tax=Burkholderia sp. PAMC 28687 TaxID=1795874 RepID=UPI000B276A32|nr:hypothetical protein [Burkholderia sp. PAMC 28687]